MNSSHKTSATKAKDLPLHPPPPLSFEETIAGYEAVHSKPFETLINEVLQDNYIALEQFRERIADKKSHFPEKLAAWANKKLAEQKDGAQKLAFTAAENYLIAMSFLTPLSDHRKAIPYIEKMVEQGHLFGIHALSHLSNKKPDDFKTLIENKPQKSLSEIIYLTRKEADYEKRRNLNQQAFEMGSEEAADNLRSEYVAWSASANPNLEKYYLTVGAQRGSTSALLSLSKVDHPDGIKYTRYLAYTVGSAAATNDLATIHKDRGEFMEAAELFLRLHILNPNIYGTGLLSEIIRTHATQNPTLFYMGWLVDIAYHIDDDIFITQLAIHTDIILQCWMDHLNSENNHYEKMRQKKAVTKMETLVAKSRLSQNQPQLLNTIKAKLACYFARTNLAKAFIYFDEVDPAKLSVKEREAFALELYGFSFRLQQSMKNKAMQAAQLSDCVALQARIASGSTRGLHFAPTQPPQVMPTVPEQKHQHMLFSAKPAAAAASAVDKDLDAVFKSLHNTFLTIYLPLFQSASAFANLGEFKETLIRKLMSMDREFSRLATSLMPDEADLAGLKSIIEHCKAEIDALPSFPNEIIESHQPLKEYFSHTFPVAFKTLLDELTEVLKPKMNAPAATQAPR